MVGAPKLRDTSGSLQSGGGDGTMNGMEDRIIKLEAIADDTKSALNSIFGQLARIDTKLDSKPDQGWIVNVVCMILGVALAAIAATAGLFTFIR
jgi:hypothetical protein